MPLSQPAFDRSNVLPKGSVSDRFDEDDDSSPPQKPKKKRLLPEKALKPRER
jgi:hypothetical protein